MEGYTVKVKFDKHCRGKKKAGCHHQFEDLFIGKTTWGKNTEAGGDRRYPHGCPTEHLGKKQKRIAVTETEAKIEADEESNVVPSQALDPGRRTSMRYARGETVRRFILDQTDDEDNSDVEERLLVEREPRQVPAL